MTTPRGIRLNNPGNIVKSSIPWQGKVQGDDPRFETFSSAFYGIRALANNLLAYQDTYGLRTVRKIINRWAPSSENNTAAYVAVVAQALGVDENEQLDLHRATVLIPLVMAIIRHENGQQPYSAQEISRAVSDALGIQPKDVPVTADPVPDGTQPKEPRMGAALLAGLIPSILQLFSGRAQAAISQATGASPDVAAKFTQDIARQIEAVSGVAVTDQASAIKAVAEVAADPAKVQALEDHAARFVLTEIGGGIQSAAEEYAAINRDLEDDAWWRIPLKFLFNMQNVVTLAFLAGVGYFVPPLSSKVADMSAEAAMGLIVLIFAVIGIVSGRWLRLTPKEKE